MRIANLSQALPLTKLKSLDLIDFNLSVKDMQALSQGIAGSGLKTLLLVNSFIDDEQDIEPIIRHLTDGLLKSCVETVELRSWALNRERLQYLMENLQNFKFLKKLSLLRCLTFQDAPFYLLECALNTTADVTASFDKFNRVNLQELAPRYKQYKETYTKQERKLFSRIFEYDRGQHA